MHPVKRNIVSSQSQEKLNEMSKLARLIEKESEEVEIHHPISENNIL
jgi:hypothetical protein